MRMTDTALLAGPSLRRLRKREGLTQAAMAASLGISPSYLNLIERNQRPLSARVAMARQPAAALRMMADDDVCVDEARLVYVQPGPRSSVSYRRRSV